MATLMTEISPDQTATSGQRVVELSFDDVTPEFALKWARLEANSVEGNAFLSPHFCNSCSDPPCRFLRSEAADTGS